MWHHDHHKMNEADMIEKSVPNANGPDPKMNFRAVEKIPNAAEKFRTENQPLSYNLCCQSINCIKHVREQNRDFPRLEKELRKKHSLKKVATINLNDLKGDFDWNCDACARLATYNYLKKSAPKPRCRDCDKKRKTSRKSTNHRSVHRSSKRKLRGIHKTKTKKEEYQLTKNRIQRSCQCSQSYIVRKKSTSTTYSTQNFEPGVDNDSKYPGDKQRHKRKKRHPSVSSYDSYGSLRQEPMDL